MHKLLVGCMVVAGMLLSVGVATASRIMSFDAADLENSGSASSTGTAVAVFDVVGDPNTKIVSYVKFVATNPSTNQLKVYSFSQAEAQLADSAPATPVEIAWVFPASDIYPNSPALTQFPADALFMDRYEDGMFAYLTIYMAEEPPIVQRPCACCTSSCTWGCLKSCYR